MEIGLLLNRVMKYKRKGGREGEKENNCLNMYKEMQLMVSIEIISGENS